MRNLILIILSVLVLVGCDSVGGGYDEYVSDIEPNHIKAYNECVDGCDICGDYDSCIDGCDYLSTRYEAVLNSGEKIVKNYKHYSDITPMIYENDSEYKCEVYKHLCDSTNVLYMCDIQYN